MHTHLALEYVVGRFVDGELVLTGWGLLVVVGLAWWMGGGSR